MFRLHGRSGGVSIRFATGSFLDKSAYGKSHGLGLRGAKGLLDCHDALAKLARFQAPREGTVSFLLIPLAF
jgi:hypothetical protein